MSRLSFVLALTLLLGCASSRERGSAGINRPMGPAEGAADYKYNPGGPHGPTPMPTTDPRAEPGEPAPAALDCPPKCADDGAWIGCGLKKPRGVACKGCTPKCKGKGTADEGWYDCSGVLIVEGKCS